ncbi:DMT family transporter [Clostridium botulinum C]|uniref:DMT family transporter n=3 Tax=Clostridium botulinum TaxID=1491 RepID=A0A9Q4TLZ8_CLOBO|nr:MULTISPECIES: DMT family transporter [Clostridium]MBO3442236.1 DMT family transporter [Clostridium haemolyticum]MCD3195626.1 DMT family transporter [Clostridium botulinum C]AYF54306.1 EamA-like transporter family protein [Clostridium novyi]EES92237.1 putative membrane protein [Clostridium botulinum D str. 1873]KEI08659.1 membrane protein [Clostridium sp. K25]
MYKIYAIIVGVLLATMISINGALSGKMENCFALIIIHLVGGLTTCILLLITRRKFSIKGIPFYFLCGGFLGFFVVFINNICVVKIGVALTLALSLLGQSIVSGIIDHYGLLGMEIHKFKKEKIIGFIIILAGIVVMTVY